MRKVQEFSSVFNMCFLKDIYLRYLFEVICSFLRRFLFVLIWFKKLNMDPERRTLQWTPVTGQSILFCQKLFAKNIKWLSQNSGKRHSSSVVTTKLLKYLQRKEKHLANNLNLEVIEPTVLDASVYGDLVKKRAFIFMLSSDNRCSKHHTKFSTNTSLSFFPQ